MKHILSIHALLVALCLAAPAAGLAAPGDFHGRYYYRHGHRFFYGPGPFLWGPAIGFSFYGGPGYSYPGYYYDQGADRPTYRGAPPNEADARDGKDAKDDPQDDLGMDVQRALARSGYYHGPLDGDIGSGSRAAIRAYQSEHGLEPTGRIDNALLHSLHID